jgi:transcriptional regulator NrdR family protein
VQCLRQAFHDLRAGGNPPAAGGQEKRSAYRIQSRQAAASLELALRKRPVSIESVDAAVAISKKAAIRRRARSQTQQLGELVMRELKKLDKVAYIRFASVYRNFEDVDAFLRAIREVSPSPKKK